MASPYTSDNTQTPVTTSIHDKYYPQQTTITPSSLTYYHPPPLPPQSITHTPPVSITANMQLPLLASTVTTKSVMINTAAPLSTPIPSTLSSSYSSTHSYLSASSSFSTSSSSTLSSSTSISSMPCSSSSSSSYFTWLVFLEERWTPFDMENQRKLEQTLSLGGTFVDIADTNFPHVKRVRVFPKTNYLSYLGVKYRLSRIMQPDAWLDHA